MWLANKKCNVTHCLLVMGRDVKGLSGKEKMQCHSLTVDYDVMRLPCKEKTHSLTSYSLWEMWWDCLAKENAAPVTPWSRDGTLWWGYLGKEKFQVMCYSHTVCHEKKCEETPWKRTNECHSLPVGQWMRRWDCLAKKKCTMTHMLLVMRSNVIGKKLQSHSLHVDHGREKEKA